MSTEQWTRITAIKPDGDTAAFVASVPATPSDLERLRLLAEQPGLRDATWTAELRETARVR